MEEMFDASNSDVTCRGKGGANTKTPSLWGPTDVRQWISCMRDRRVLKSVGGDRAAVRLAHASQLSSALQMTLGHGPKSVRMNCTSFDTCEALTPPTNQTVNTASWLHTATRDFTEAPRRWMQFWDKLGCVELCAMDQIQVNIPPLLLLVAAECKPCLWSEESVCVDMRPPANPVWSAPSSQPGH